MANPIPSGAVEDPALLGDHPALNLLNTVVRVNGLDVEQLNSDDDVLRWLARLGLPLGLEEARPPPGLLQAARTLREVIRPLVVQRQAGKPLELSALNVYLRQCRSYLELVPQAQGELQLVRVWPRETAEQSLAPLAEAAAELLARGDFELVRRCENSECVLWFYDRTKSHHRRWCSMATCGNRHKVAAFRQRQQEGVR
jgi:predicted RNA-binding Zn ribbon-like protein